MNSSQTVPILLNLCAAVFGALGQYAYKKGALQLGSVSILKNYSLWLGVLLFCVVMVLFVIGYKLGGRISVVYPFYATTFIWGTLIGYYFDKEPINLYIIFGSVLILAGLSVMAKSLDQGLS